MSKYNMELTEKERNIIYDEVERMANQYFDLKLESIYKNELFINFKVLRFERKFEAYARKDIQTPNTYLVRISAGALVRLMDLENDLAFDEEFIKLLNPLKGKKSNPKHYFLFLC